MILIPGFLISLLTFPGVILHEFAHKIVANLFGVKVLEVKYFLFTFKLFGGEAGYVRHEIPSRYIESLCISAAPFLINSLATLLVGYFASTMDQSSVAYMFTIWLGISFGAHAFPSNQDMDNVRQFGKQEHYAVSLFSNLLYYLMVVLNFASRFWLDFVYAYLLLTFVGAV
jgi:hypothetical protein